MSRPSDTGDRRQCPRFEPNGVLGATLELDCPVLLKQVAPDHALVEGPLIWDFKWIRFAQLVFNDGRDVIDVLVRYLRPSPKARQQIRCLIELDLVKLSVSNLADLKRILRESELKRFLSWPPRPL